MDSEAQAGAHQKRKLGLISEICYGQDLHTDALGIA